MRALSGGYGRWCTFVGVVVVGVAAYSFSVQRVAAQRTDEGHGKTKGTRTTAVSSRIGAEPARSVVRFGSGSLKNVPVQVFRTVTVDYRDDGLPLSRSIGDAVAIGKRAEGHAGTASRQLAGQDCILDIECNDCNPCTLDTCSDSVCVGGGRDGFGCEDDRDCEGTCAGGVNDGGLCRDDLDCCGDGGAIADGVCNFNPCTLIESPARSQCVNALIPDGRFETGSECDDGLDCNGFETCNSAIQECVPGTPLCTADEVCDETNNSCLAPCQSDVECETDGRRCTNDVCDARRCVGGDNDGLVCQTDANCPGGTCTGGGTGACIVGPSPCGPNGACTEASVCVGGSNDGEVCADNLQCPGGSCSGSGVDCGTGRCCDGQGVPDCAPVTFADCAGVWLADPQACLTLETGNRNLCPIYGSGIAPQGTFEVEVGSVISSVAPTCPNTLSSVGDDYKIGDGTGFVQVTFLRYVASIQASVRMAIAFYDANGVFIEDVFIPDGFNAGVAGPTVFTADFDPPLTVPATGFVVMSVQTNFGPFGQFSWVSTNGADSGGGPGVDLGTNDPNKMWANGAPTSNFLGRCDGGTRDGQWCDVSGAAATCPGGGTCTDVPDVLAFEIVALTGAGAPDGACCEAAGTGCTVELPWVCEAQGNAFQGAGSFCKSCSNDLLQGCQTAADCPPKACVGGNNDGLACDTDADCLPGGLCTGVPVCLPVPPACSFQACCDPTGAFGPAGECLALGGTCVGNTQIPCASDADCITLAKCVGGTGDGQVCDPTATPDQCSDGTVGTGGTCTVIDDFGPCTNPLSPTNECPGGTESRGFGSFCGPNCCQQPSLDGGPTCRDVAPQVISVPPFNSPTTVTLTGNNDFNNPPSTRFSSFTNAECVGGTGDGLGCDPTVAPDPCDDGTVGTGGVCTRICGAGIFNPDGTTQDPGWWMAFSIDACADVRLDMCCSDKGGDPLRPAWAGLYPQCPCSIVLGNDGVEPPVGIGEGTAGFARGGPFCSEDNLWMTFKGLPPGNYYYPIYSAPDGTFASPPGGTFQFHITVQGCRLAACCSPVCVGGTRDGLPCNVAGFDACPGPRAQCIDDGMGGGVCDSGPRMGFACDLVTGAVDECPGAGVCGDVDGSARGCNEVSELDCTTAGGRWLAGVDFPDRVCQGGNNDGEQCSTDDQCPGGGTCVENPERTFCSPVNPCETGSCCLGPGSCVDRDPVTNDPLTKPDCDGLGGDFVGGSRCLFEPPPCPICTVAEAGNCQLPNAGFIVTMDRINGFGRKVADDFIANSETIEQFCFSPAFTNTPDNECADLDRDGFAPPPDDFEIRFFTDANGVPGTLVHELAPAQISAKAFRGGNSRVWDYSIVFDPPLGSPSKPPPFIIGDRYWIEFSGAGNADCTVFIQLSLDGNGFYYQEADHFSDAQEWTFEDRGGDNTDISFCIGGPSTPSIEIPPRLTGACCECDGTCTDNAGAGVPWEDCVGEVCLDDSCESRCSPDDQSNPCTILPLFNRADFFPDQTCAAVACAPRGQAGGCPGAVAVEGEDCAFPKVLVPPDPTQKFTITYDTNCSTTDGRVSFEPPIGNGCDTSPQPGENFEITFENDQWFQYTSTCTGKFQLDLCGDLSFDGILAVYTNGTSQCPTECPPPIDDLVGGKCQDTLCPDVPLGDPSFKAGTSPGICYLIRIGGERDDDNGSGAAGVGQMSIFCKPELCFESTPPVTELGLNINRAVVNALKNRYLTFKAGDAGKRQAIRVRFDDLPGSFSAFNGTEMWVGSTRRVSVKPGKGYGATVGSDDFFVHAELQCDPLFQDWSQVAVGSKDGFIHVHDVNIIPGGTYTIQIIDDSCDPNLEGDFSAPLVIQTSGRWADMCGPITSAPACVCCAAPDPASPDTDTVNDVLGVLDAFGEVTLTKIQADLQGIDLITGQPSPILDGTIDVGEISATQDEFSNAQGYPFGPGAAPCTGLASTP